MNLTVYEGGSCPPPAAPAVERNLNVLVKYNDSEDPKVNGPFTAAEVGPIVAAYATRSDVKFVTVQEAE